MKSLSALGLVVCMLGTTAQASTLLCASKKDAEIYFTEGQVRLTATIESPTQLTDISFSVKGGENTLNSDTKNVDGEATSKYVRFDLESSLFCNYRIALPKNFSTQSKTVLFVDASCEDDYKYSVPLNCAVE